MFTVRVRFLALGSTLKYLSNFIKMLCMLSSVYIGKVYCKTGCETASNSDSSCTCLSYPGSMGQIEPNLSVLH